MYFFRSQSPENSQELICKGTSIVPHVTPQSGLVQENTMMTPTPAAMKQLFVQIMETSTSKRRVHLKFIDTSKKNYCNVDFQYSKYLQYACTEGPSCLKIRYYYYYYYY